MEREGIASIPVASLEELADLVDKSVGAVLVTEEALSETGFDGLSEALQAQPPWSDVPFVVLATGSIRNRSEEAARRVDRLRNAVLLSRPLHAEELIRSVRSALKARGRQHEARVRMEELQLREAQLHESEAKLQAITDSVDQMIWSTLPDGFHDYYNSRWYEYTGVPEGSTDGEAWNGMFHPDDQQRAWDTWRHSLRTGEPYEIEYRLRHRSGEYRWVLGRALPVLGQQGEILRWYGTCTDIHERKVAEEQRQLMLAEMNHRVKNSLTMVQAIVSQTLRRAGDLSEARELVLTRVRMLAVAHDRLIGSGWGETTFRAVVEAALEPHMAGERVISADGPELRLGSKQALALTMALHELATNAAKYGALSAEGGHVSVLWDIAKRDTAELLILTWRESGGPPVSKPNRQGFGSRMIEQALAGYFAGKAELDFAPDGLIFSMEAPLDGLTS
jgi:PAS domain S-box-containing protein